MNFSALRAFIVDIDGTLWRGHTPLPGLNDLFNHFLRNDLAFVVASNNTSETPAEYWRRLYDLGVELSPKQVMTAGAATVDYLEQEFNPGTEIYVLGEPALRKIIRSAGFALAPDGRRHVEAVVVGGDSRLTYAKLKNAILHVQQGAAFIGTNPDLLVPTEEGLVPEAGTILAAIQAATGIEPTVIGKPALPLFQLALARLGSFAHETAVVGDRLETDILGAQRAGIRSILVTTGVDSASSVTTKRITPDAVVSGLPELVKLLANGG
ncbi:MAG: HAD-IIA family hydrolase [Anaerolineae bacterium]